MCLIAWHWQSHAPQQLLLLANRDEFYARPTQALNWWDGQDLLAGRDLSAGGTWLGVTRNGRVAALTNHRDPSRLRADAESRGHLVANFLLGHQSAADYVQAVLATVERYNPFNLLVGDGQQLMALESRHARAFAVGSGIGAVSNADFNTPWPKLVKLRSGLSPALDPAQSTPDQALWDLLSDDQLAPDADLPQTGISLERERALSAAFIRTPDYGTRCSTLLRLGPNGLSMQERRFDYHGLLGQSAFTA